MLVRASQTRVSAYIHTTIMLHAQASGALDPGPGTFSPTQRFGKTTNGLRALAFVNGFSWSGRAPTIASQGCRDGEALDLTSAERCQACYRIKD